ncbi:MAG TPA: ABC transporter ATP-binding protein [Nocardioidaceae bacterium]|nr:ABC transporter ATP-binding protein [Nocardioidaceae bacterium]
MTRKNAIEATGLRKTYGDRVAVDALDLNVETGTVLGFLGPNGAGKTTVIRMLSTVLRPDQGHFVVAGVPDTRPADIRRCIGVLPEGAGYPPAQTAEEWLSYHGRLFGASRRVAGDDARRLLSEVGLAERADSRIASLSRGLRQRLGIARAMINNPEVVFLDEPTLGLDPTGQRQVLGLVARIARDHGVTVVLSTHTLTEVEQICHRVVILNRGRVVADGTVGEIVKLAAAPRRGVLQVPVDLRQRAVDALAAQGIEASVTQDRQDEVELVLPADMPPDQASAAALRCLLDDGVPVLGLTLEGGRLNDAFLAVTEGASDE